jgi:hypothetical protein
VSLQLHDHRLVPEAWYVLLKKFATDEWLRIPLGILTGTIFVAAKRLTVDDGTFRSFVERHWQNSALRTDFNGFAYYRIEFYTIAAVLSLLALTFCLPMIWRVLDSWVHGVVSGLTAIWGLSFFIFLGFEPLSLIASYLGPRFLHLCFRSQASRFIFWLPHAEPEPIRFQ